MIPPVIVHSPETTNTDIAVTDTPTEPISGNTQCETQSSSITCKCHLRSNHEKVRYCSYTMYFIIKSAGF